MSQNTAPAPDSSENKSQRVVISVDAMGGDKGPAAVVAGCSHSAKRNDEIHFLLHGSKAELEPLVARKKPLQGRCEIIDAQAVVSMEDKPSQVIRSGRDSSMWSALESVRNGDATVCVSCGNTGALMALSVIRLRKLPGVYRPAIGVLWPSRNPQGYNVMLDGGADIRADERDLMQYALMGASYARNGLALARPRVGLLNVGTEEHKGRAEIQAANELIAENADAADFEYVGFVEGKDLPGSACDVIVTDGFTGNVALKTGEGIAGFISDQLREAFKYTPLSRVAALLAYPSLRRLRKRIDPRMANGGVFLGLNGTVVKSHGSADATGVSAAVKLAFQLAQSGFNERLAARISSATMLASERDRDDDAAERGNTT